MLCLTQDPAPQLHGELLIRSTQRCNKVVVEGLDCPSLLSTQYFACDCWGGTSWYSILLVFITFLSSPKHSLSKICILVRFSRLSTNPLPTVVKNWVVQNSTLKFGSLLYPVHIQQNKKTHQGFNFFRLRVAQLTTHHAKNPFVNTPTMESVAQYPPLAQ